MNKPNRLTLPLLALSSALLLSGAALAAEDKKPEAAPAPAAPVAMPVKPAAAQPVAFTVPDPVAVVNGKPISKAMFDQYAQQLRGRTKVDSPESSKALVDQLVMEELLLQEAIKQKLAEDPQIKRQLEMMQNNLLASSVVRKMLSENAPSEEAIKKEYDTAVAAMKGKEYKASHILVDSEDKAKAIIEELKKGRQLRRTGQDQVQRQLRSQWRRSGLVLAEHDGAAVRAGRRQAGEGQVHRTAGADPVWLARHPARGYPRRDAALNG